MIGVKELIFVGSEVGTGHTVVGNKESFGGAHAEETVGNIHIFKAVRSTCIGHVSVPGTEVGELFGFGHKDVFACIGTGSRHEGEDLIDISPVVGSENGVAFVTGILVLRHGEVVVGRGGRCRFTFCWCHRGGDGVALQSELLRGAEFGEPCTLCLGEGSVEGCNGSVAGSLSAGSVIQCVLRFGDGCGQGHIKRGGLHTDFLCSREAGHQRLKVGLESGGIVDGCLKFITRKVGAEQPARSLVRSTGVVTHLQHVVQVHGGSAIDAENHHIVIEAVRGEKVKICSIGKIHTRSGTSGGAYILVKRSVIDFESDVSVGLHRHHFVHRISRGGATFNCITTTIKIHISIYTRCCCIVTIGSSETNTIHSRNEGFAGSVSCISQRHQTSVHGGFREINIIQRIILLSGTRPNGRHFLPHANLTEKIGFNRRSILIQINCKNLECRTTIA